MGPANLVLSLLFSVVALAVPPRVPSRDCFVVSSQRSELGAQASRADTIARRLAGVHTGLEGVDSALGSLERWFRLSARRRHALLDGHCRIIPSR